MKQMLPCMLAIGLMLASTGCQVAHRQALSDSGPVDAAAYWNEMGCQDGSCQGGGLPVDGAYCADGAVCGDGMVAGTGAFCADGLCGGCGRCRAALQTMRQNVRSHFAEGCQGRSCGKAIGPTAGAVVYPYYTVRGPRDFLVDNPPSIGR